MSWLGRLRGLDRIDDESMRSRHGFSISRITMSGVTPMPETGAIPSLASVPPMEVRLAVYYDKSAAIEDVYDILAIVYSEAVVRIEEDYK